MKSISKITLFVLGFVLALVSCRQKEQEPVEWRTELQVVSSDLVFMPTGGSAECVLNVSGASVESNASWCQASVSGTKVNVTVGEWGELVSRYAVLTLTRNGESVQVNVIQYGVSLGGIEVEPSVHVDGAGGSLNYPCSANAAVSVSSNVDWLTASVTEGQLTLAVSPNPVKAVRSALVTIHIGEVVKEVSVMQYPVFENTPDWVVSYSGTGVSGGTTYSILTNTVSADLGMYTVTVGTREEFAASGLSEEDYVRDVLAAGLADDINYAVSYYNGQYPFSAFLLSGTDWDYVTLLEDGVYIGYAIGFDADGNPTGWYTADEIKVGGPTPYQMWLGEWSVPRGDGADTWIVSQDVENESYKVSGIAGFDADDYATGAFVAIVAFDAETNEMVFKVYENSITWQDTNRGAMNALLSGQYTNVEGKTYYNSGVGNVIARAKMSEDGLKAELTPRSVTSAGAPAFFSNIRWYGRYTTSSGSRSGVSWNGYETALPNTMTKK